MKRQQVRQAPLIQPSFILTDLLKMASPQGVLLKLKSPEQIIQTFEGVVMENDNILDFQRVRLLQGGIEVDLFVMSRLAPDMKLVKGSPTDEKESRDSKMCVETIEIAINQIFEYKRFRQDRIMANSPLHRLVVVEQACQARMRTRGLLLSSLSQQDKASVLRKFLTQCVDNDLCPEPGLPAPKNLSKSAFRNEWVEYLILRWQHIGGESRDRVIRELEKRHYSITRGSSYTRHLNAARARLASIVYQKEMLCAEAPYS